MPSQGSCIDPLDRCTSFESTAAFCTRECTTDADCAGARVAGRRAASICRGEFCVEAETSDDEACRFHALGGEPTTACRAEALCLGFDQLTQPGEGICLQLCTPTPSDPTGGCAAPLPVCNPNVLNTGMSSIGVCSERVLRVGARCRGGASYTRRCDSDPAAGPLYCLSNDLVDVWDELPEEEGFCVEDCDPNAVPSCPETSDPNLGPGTCVNIGEGVNGPIGMCSHGCTYVPDECGRTGLGHGSRCLVAGLTTGTGPGGDVALCTDVQPPTIAEARVTNSNNIPRLVPGAPSAPCFGSPRDGTRLRCEQGTWCTGVEDSFGASSSGCVRLCAPDPSGATTPSPLCASSASPNAECFWLRAGTSTVVEWGFCATP